jgi:hypothetical protein
VVVSKKKSPITIQDNPTPSLDENRNEWILNNPPGSNKFDWLRIPHPLEKIYETGGDDLPLERHPVEPGIDQWMTNWHLLSMVRATNYDVLSQHLGSDSGHGPASYPSGGRQY